MLKFIRWGSFTACNYSSESFLEIKMALEEGRLDGLVIWQSSSFSESDLNILNKLPPLKMLALYGFSKSLDLSVVESINALEELALDGKAAVVDFCLLPSLRRLYVEWWDGVFVNEGEANLIGLKVGKLSTDDLAPLASFQGLQELDLVQPKIKSLLGIEYFHGLRVLSVYAAKKLTDISGINDGIRELCIEQSGSIADYGPIASCKSIEVLRVHRSAAFKSLSFVSGLKQLQSFRFMNTDVLDGDLSFLSGIPDVCFTQKKHFSHKLKDFADKGV
ncbi:MAG: hypothetical protein Q8J78_16000 [Moraxellaceae bacterium]|nr:hypothetical protein [Moraxellaceae bacterium]